MTATPLSIRREQVMKLADFTSGRGLEIGPLNQPLLTKDVADVRYVDVFSGTHLRAHYAQDPNVDVEDIPDIDFVLSSQDGVQDLSNAVRPAAPYAWVVASHVIEHVPDVITWLSQIAEITEDGATLLLVVPDRRFCFDILRPATTMGQMLQAYELEEKSPSVRAVYDHFRSHVTVDAAEAWQGFVPSNDSRTFNLTGVMTQLRLAREGQYVDSHVWAFTPASFVEQLTELGRFGLCDFVIENVVPTAENQLEFFVVLRRLRRGLTAGEADSARARGMHDLTDEAPCSRHQAETKASAFEARERISVLEDELAQIKSSERWRLGGLAAVPASLVKRLLSRI